MSAMCAFWNSVVKAPRKTIHAVADVVNQQEQPAQESLMATTPRSANVRNRPRLPTTANGLRQTAVRAHRLRPVPDPARRRVNPVTIGFWLGGVCLGTAGCILGARMPYRHPVAVTMSVLWWGMYFGCFGAGIGALFGSWKTRTAVRCGPTTLRSPADPAASQAPRPAPLEGVE
jgi:hypothetical protein